MLGHADRANSWTTPSMRDAEGLVEIQVADIRTDVTGAAESDLGVHVSAVHVDLTTCLVDHGADLLDSRLEDAVG